MKKLDWYLKWVATALICVGAALISLDIYPIGPIVSNVGTLIWLIVSIMWREKSLIVVNVVVFVIYTSGLLYKLLT
jgi:hypothetical protein